MRDSEGRITHLIPSGVDITARKEAEQKLQAQLVRVALLNQITAPSVNARISRAFSGSDSNS